MPAEATGTDPVEPLVPGPASRLANFGSGPSAAAAGTAIRESCSLRDLFAVIQSLAHVLREVSAELADRGLALQARSRELQHRVHALRKRHVGLRAGRLAQGWPSRFLARAVRFLAESSGFRPSVRFPGRVVRPRSRPGPAPDPDAVTPSSPWWATGNRNARRTPPILPRYLSADPGETEVPLLGGDMTEGVVRVGRTVRRPVRPHTPAVHALLRHLEAVGFDGAPRVLGIDGRNREVLTYLPGFTGRRSLPDLHRRRFHSRGPGRTAAALSPGGDRLQTAAGGAVGRRADPIRRRPRGHHLPLRREPGERHLP